MGWAFVININRVFYQYFSEQGPFKSSRLKTFFKGSIMSLLNGLYDLKKKVETKYAMR